MKAENVDRWMPFVGELLAEWGVEHPKLQRLLAAAFEQVRGGHVALDADGKPFTVGWAPPASEHDRIARALRLNRQVD